MLRRGHRHRYGLAGFVLAASALLVGPALAQDRLDAVIELDGTEASLRNVNDPLVLDADQPLQVRVSATNTTTEPVLLRSVRLKSTVMGLTFLAYETRIDLEIPPDAAREVAFELDLLDLRSQATGVLPAQIELLDADRDGLAVVPLTVDVQGSLASVYGMFGVGVMALTAFALILAFVRLAGGRLPANRWARGLQFATPGLGIGLVATIGLSTVRIFSPEPGLWATLLVVGGAIGFGLGYLTPAPSREEIVDLEDLAVAVVPAEEGDDSARPGRTASPGSSKTTIAGLEPPSEPDR